MLVIRKLASIQRVIDIKPIEGRDRIELAFIEGWQVVVKKDEFKVGDLCVYIEIDSVLPEKPEFEFLRSKNFRIKTMKMGGVLSQGIAFPLSILPGSLYQEGDDVTNVIGVVKYDEYKDEPKQELKEDKNKDKKLYKFLRKHKLTRWLAKLIYPRKANNEFPKFIKKTDETRIQNAPFYLKNKSPFIVTEKLDGTSATYFVKRNHGLKALKNKVEFGVCSRNRLLPVRDDSVYWEMEKEYDIFLVLYKLLDELDGVESVCLQGEIIGEKVQDNQYKLDHRDFYAFNLIVINKFDRHGNVVERNRFNSIAAKYMLEKYGIPFVPILDERYTLPDTVDEMLKYADGDSVISPVRREGLVIRDHDGDISFKVVSNEYLLSKNK